MSEKHHRWANLVSLAALAAVATIFVGNQLGDDASVLTRAVNVVVNPDADFRASANAAERSAQRQSDPDEAADPTTGLGGIDPNLIDPGPVGGVVERGDELDPEGLEPQAPIEPQTNFEPGGEPSLSNKVMRFVYFVESDQEFDPTAVDKIAQQAVALQTFWFEQFGGTFRLDDDIVDVIYGDQPAAWYATTEIGDDERWYRLMNMREEVRAKLGLEADDTTVRVVTFPNARIDGRVGANRYGGAWMDGDDIACIDGSVPSTPYTQDFPASCLGTVAHELGHVYGLSHEGEEADCMQFGFYEYVIDKGMCDFSADSRAAVAVDPGNTGWLDALPGDRS